MSCVDVADTVVCIMLNDKYDVHYIRFGSSRCLIAANCCTVMLAGLLQVECNYQSNI